MSNLDSYRAESVKVKQEPITLSTIVKYYKWVKDNWHKITVVAMAIWIAGSTGMQYYKDHINESTTVIVDEQTFQEAVNRNTIKDLPRTNQILSRFSNDSVRAELVIPTSVDTYKLVKIKTDKVATFYDLLVMTVYNGNIVFVDTVQTSNKGEWVFTGPPGQYAIRLSCYDQTTGISVETGNVIIGQPSPPTPPNPPNPTPTPTPTPNPAPVFTEKYGFSTLAYNSAMKVEATARKQYKESLANNFESVAAAIAAGSFDTPNAANTELAGRNRMTFNNNQTEINKWLQFFTDWQTQATQLNKDGKLPNLVDEYRLIYLETAKGLRAIQ